MAMLQNIEKPLLNYKLSRLFSTMRSSTIRFLPMNYFVFYQKILCQKISSFNHYMVCQAKEKWWNGKVSIVFRDKQRISPIYVSSDNAWLNSGSRLHGSCRTLSGDFPLFAEFFYRAIYPKEWLTPTAILIMLLLPSRAVFGSAEHSSCSLRNYSCSTIKSIFV